MLNNLWNKARYSAYTPFYSLIVYPFKKYRKASIAALSIKPYHKVLVVGCGAGNDFEFLPECDLYAIDITPSMIWRAKRKSLSPDQVQVMDAQQMNYADAEFDYVICHLILAVVPNPEKCMKEVYRVLRPGGTLAVFDKFLESKPSFIRQLANAATSVLATSINRSLKQLVAPYSLSLEYYEPVLGTDLFVIARYKKK